MPSLLRDVCVYVRSWGWEREGEKRCKWDEKRGKKWERKKGKVKKKRGVSCKASWKRVMWGKREKELWHRKIVKSETRTQRKKKIIAAGRHFSTSTALPLPLLQFHSVHFFPFDCYLLSLIPHLLYFSVRHPLLFTIAYVILWHRKGLTLKC